MAKLFVFNEKIKLFFLSSVMLLACGTTFAQTHFSIHAGGAFPMGGFAESDIDKWKWSLASESKDNGGAGTGFNVGLKLKFDIHSVSGLGVVVGADFFYNGMNSDVKDASDDYENCDITLPKYLNIPVMVGLNYEHAISSSCKLYGEVALGLNFRIITDITVEGFAQFNYDGSMYPYELTIDYDRATSFGFQHLVLAL